MSAWTLVGRLRRRSAAQGLVRIEATCLLNTCKNWSTLQRSRRHAALCVHPCWGSNRRAVSFMSAWTLVGRLRRRSAAQGLVRIEATCLLNTCKNWSTLQRSRRHAALCVHPCGGSNRRAVSFMSVWTLVGRLRKRSADQGLVRIEATCLLNTRKNWSTPQRSRRHAALCVHARI